MQYFVFTKNNGAINQFCDGMNDLGVLDVLRQFPNSTRSLFFPREELTARKMRDIFRIHLTSTQDGDLLDYFFRFLDECESKSYRAIAEADLENFDR